MSAAKKSPNSRRVKPRDARQVPCPMCGAKEGLPCTDKDGVGQKQPHPARRQAFRRKGRPPAEMWWDHQAELPRGRVLSVPCPVCRAEAGVGCRRGVRTGEQHFGRIELARKYARKDRLERERNIRAQQMRVRKGRSA